MAYPPQLPSATPRAVESSLFHLVVLITLSVVCAFVWLIVSWIIVPDIIQQKNLRDRGVEETAEVTGLHLENHKGSIHHHVTYAFHVKDGFYTGESVVSEKDYLKLNIGSKIDIVYDPTKLETSQQNIENYTQSGQGYKKYISIFLAISAIIAGAYVAVMLHMLRSRQFEMRLLMWGAQTTAKITRETQYETRQGKRSKITYEFSVPGHGTFIGTRDDIPTEDSPHSFEAALRKALIESPIALYQPDDPRKNALYPLTEVSLRQ